MIRIASCCLIGVMMVINISIAGCNETREGTGVVSPQDQVRLDRLRRWKEYASLITKTYDREVTKDELAKVEIAIRSYLPAIMTPSQIDKSFTGGTQKIQTKEGERWFLGSWYLGPRPGGYFARSSAPVYEGKEDLQMTLILLRVDDKLVVTEAKQAHVLLRR